MNFMKSFYFLLAPTSRHSYRTLQTKSCCPLLARGILNFFHGLVAVGHLFSPVDVQWSPPGLAASRRLFLMLTLLWGAESADDASEASRAVAGVEERAGTRGVAKNGISFPRAGVRKLDSLSEDLLGPNNKISQWCHNMIPDQSW